MRSVVLAVDGKLIDLGPEMRTQMGREGSKSYSSIQ